MEDSKPKQNAQLKQTYSRDADGEWGRRHGFSRSGFAADVADTQVSVKPSQSVIASINRRLKVANGS